LIRNARPDDVPAIRELINSYAELGQMLFRSLAELYGSLRDFKLYEHEGQVVGCCALTIIWADLAELRSLAVKGAYQGRGVGSALVRTMLEDARQLHLPKVFILTLEEEFFGKLGFAKVPMSSLPMKVWSDCINCPKQDQCDEIAMVYELD